MLGMKNTTQEFKRLQRRLEMLGERVSESSFISTEIIQIKNQHDKEWENKHHIWEQEDPT